MIAPETLRQFKREIYQPYGWAYYVPMAEAYNVQLPVTVGCSWNKCLYCDLNGTLSFRVLGLDEIAENVRKLRCIHSKPARRFLLAGGNPFVLDTETLLTIAGLIRDSFPAPECEYISCFARADDVTRKSSSELKALASAGYDRLCLGIESGSDEVLAYHDKGITSEENLLAMKSLDEAGMKYSAYIMLGLGGRDLSEVHVEATAKLLNAASPFELTVVTLVLFKNARLAEKVRAHEFRRLPPIDALREGRNLLELLEIPTVWNATHKTNLFPVKGRIPEHKDLLLKRIDDELMRIESEGLKQYEMRRWRNWGNEA